MRFDLTDLRLFLAIAEAGSITHGAAAIGLSLPAASQRLRDMETFGDVALLNRDSRGVTLTEAGDALAHHARLILRQMSKMRGDLGAYAKGLRSSVRLYANTAAVVEHLPSRLGPWMATHPQIDLDLKERQSAEVAHALRAGFADLGILSNTVDTDGLHVHPFADDRLVAVVARSSDLANRSDIAFEELADRPFIGLAGGALQEHLNNQAARQGFKLKLRIALLHLDDICRMVALDVGVGVVPERAAHRATASNGVRAIALRDRWSNRKLLLCTAEQSCPSLVVQDLLASLGAEFQDGPV